MSYSSLLKVYRTKVTCIKEYKNGWGTGPIIWGYLAERYLHNDCWLAMKPIQPLWDLVDDTRVPECLRLIHSFCFDKAVLPVDKLECVGKQFQEGAKILANWAPNHANHWHEIGADLIQMKPKDKRLIGIGLNCTSVQDAWEGYNGNSFNAYELALNVKQEVSV